MKNAGCPLKRKREFEQLEQEIATLEDEKKTIEAALCSGTLSVEEPHGEIKAFARDHGFD